MLMLLEGEIGVEVGGSELGGDGVRLLASAPDRTSSIKR